MTEKNAGTGNKEGRTFLEVIDLHVNFGGVEAIHGLSFSIATGMIFSIIGPNGAGKTTAINTITGIYSPHRGDILFMGKSIVGLRPFQIARLGIARTFQQVQLFSNMTVLENVATGFHCKMKSGLFGGLIHHWRERKEEKEVFNRAKAILDFFGLLYLADSMPSHITIGEQKRLEIARAMASNPMLILLDEPAAGLNVRETEDMAELIIRICKKGHTIVIVEHNMHLVMNVSERVMVLHHGRKISEGPPLVVQRDRTVMDAYLGG
ncbi:MAG: ABC transporter ATP-binding protein [Candidatus Bathyarchaeia archaeon]